MHQLSFFENNHKELNKKINSKYSNLNIGYKELSIYNIKNFINNCKLFDTVFNLYMRFYCKTLDGKKLEDKLLKTIKDIDEKFESQKTRLMGIDYQSYHYCYEQALSFVEDAYKELKDLVVKLAKSSAKTAMFS